MWTRSGPSAGSYISQMTASKNEGFSELLKNQHCPLPFHMCLSPLISIDMNKTTAVVLRLAKDSFNESMQFGWTVFRCIGKIAKRDC
jgi:hypothetical protein